MPYGKGESFEGPEAIIPTLPEHTPYVFYTMLGAGHEMCALPTGYMNHVIASFIERYVVRGEQASVHVEESFNGPTPPGAMPFYILNCNPYPKETVIEAVKAAFPEYAASLQ